MLDEKINVLGASGFIGGRFCEIFSDKVIPNERNDFTIKSKNILYFISTVDNYNIHEDLTLDVETNLKVFTSFLQNVKNNKDVTLNFISSWFVYGKNYDIPFDEDLTQCNPKGFYSITKLCAENMLKCFCETFGIRYRILRLSNVLGEMDKKISSKKNALQFLIKKITENEDIHLYYNGEVLRDYLYVDDICEGINLCIEKAPINQIINIGRGSPSRLLDVVELALKKSDSSSKIINIQPSDFHNIVQVRHSYLNTKKIKSYGFTPKYSMEMIVDKLVEFYSKK